MVDLSREEIAEQVRRDRYEHGLTLGELMDKYPAGSIVDAFGVLGLSQIMGIGAPPVDPETGEPIDGPDDSDLEDEFRRHE